MCPCLGQGLFMPYLCELFFVFIFSTFFWIITCLKKANNFQIAKVQHQEVLLSFWLIFCHFRPGVAYKGAVYKEKAFIVLRLFGIVSLP